MKVIEQLFTFDLIYSALSLDYYILYSPSKSYSQKLLSSTITKHILTFYSKCGCTNITSRSQACGEVCTIYQRCHF